MNRENRRRLLLITAGFPYGQSERGFIPTEFAQLQQQFDIYILAIGTKEPLIYPLDEKIHVERFCYPALRNSPASLLKLLHCVLDLRFWQEIASAIKGQSFATARSRCKGILAYHLNAQSIQKTILRIVEDQQIDMIYTYWCTAATLGAAFLKKRLPELKVITRFHGFDLYQERSDMGWQPFRKVIAKNLDLLVFIGEAGRQYFLSHWGREYAEKAKLAYLGSSAQAPVQQKKTDVLHLISCSNLIPLKRVGLIIDGLAQLPETVQVSWNHIGDGPEREALEQEAREKLAGRSNVQWKFWGAVPNPRLPDVYREIGAEVFITTSSTEGVPVSIQEASALGIPTIGTAVGGIPETILDGKTGYLLPQDVTGVQVAQTIVRYAELSEEQRRTMAATAFALWQERFDAQKNAEEFVTRLYRI